MSGNRLLIPTEKRANTGRKRTKNVSPATQITHRKMRIPDKKHGHPGSAAFSATTHRKREPPGLTPNSHLSRPPQRRPTRSIHVRKPETPGTLRSPGKARSRSKTQLCASPCWESLYEVKGALCTGIVTRGRWSQRPLSWPREPGAAGAPAKPPARAKPSNRNPPNLLRGPSSAYARQDAQTHGRGPNTALVPPETPQNISTAFEEASRPSCSPRLGDYEAPNPGIPRRITAENVFLGRGPSPLEPACSPAKQATRPNS